MERTLLGQTNHLKNFSRYIQHQEGGCKPATLNKGLNHSHRAQLSDTNSSAFELLSSCIKDIAL